VAARFVVPRDRKVKKETIMQMRQQTAAVPSAARRAVSSVMSCALAISIAASGVAAGALPAQAQGLAAGLAPLGGHAAGPTTVQAPPPPGWRPGPYRPGWRPPPPPRHARWGNPYWRNGGWYYRDNSGAWVAAGIIGAAIGAAAISAAQQNAQRQQDAVAYCMQRFRSYNPRTGTYTGYDGLQHPCP